jgi:hypothetical protein
MDPVSYRSLIWGMMGWFERLFGGRKLGLGLRMG